jgi:serine protease Do
MPRKPSLRFLILAALAAAILSLLLVFAFNLKRPPARVSFSLPTKPAIVLGSQGAAERVQEARNFSEVFEKIAEALVPTVVYIKSTRTISTDDFERFHDREDLRDFFRFRLPQEFRQLGTGSGIIVSKEGYILTNVHVVERSDKIRVVLNDNREFDGKIIGMDPLTEVAVLKIASENLPVAELGDSDQCRVGEWVLSIGNPLELQSTVTAGIISAKERQIDILRNQYSVESFIQTDAAINPGNSGGALVNLQGEVIGMNTAIATETGYNSGYGFAIPINLARKIMTDLIQKGRVERGYLGISMQDIDEKRARALALPKPMGVFVDRVLEGGPAAAAGLRAKDVLLKINNQPVNKSNQVQAVVARKNPNETVQLTVLRRGSEMEIPVRLGQRENEALEIARRTASHQYEDLGITCETLSREQAREIGYLENLGVLVTKVERFSPADDAGLREQDIIIEIDDFPIYSKSEFQKVIRNLPTGAVAIFTVVRDDDRFHIFIEKPY